MPRQLITYNSEVTELMFMFRKSSWHRNKYISNTICTPRWLLPPRIMELSKLSLREKLLPVGPRRHAAIARKWAAEASSEWASVTGKKGRTRKGRCENRSFLGISTAEPPCFRDLHLPEGPFGSLPHCPPLLTASHNRTSPSVAWFQPNA